MVRGSDGFAHPSALTTEVESESGDVVSIHSCYDTCQSDCATEDSSSTAIITPTCSWEDAPVEEMEKDEYRDSRRVVDDRKKLRPSRTSVDSVVKASQDPVSDSDSYRSTTPTMQMDEYGFVLEEEEVPTLSAYPPREQRPMGLEYVQGTIWLLEGIAEEEESSLDSSHSTIGAYGELKSSPDVVERKARREAVIYSPECSPARPSSHWSSGSPIPARSPITPKWMPSPGRAEVGPSASHPTIYLPPPESTVDSEAMRYGAAFEPPRRLQCGCFHWGFHDEDICEMLRNASIESVGIGLFRDCISDRRHQVRPHASNLSRYHKKQTTPAGNQAIHSPRLYRNTGHPNLIPPRAPGDRSAKSGSMPAD